MKPTPNDIDIDSPEAHKRLMKMHPLVFEFMMDELKYPIIMKQAMDATIIALLNLDKLSTEDQAWVKRIIHARIVEQSSVDIDHRDQASINKMLAMSEWIDSFKRPLSFYLK